MNVVVKYEILQKKDFIKILRETSIKRFVQVIKINVKF